MAGPTTQSHRRACYGNNVVTTFGPLHLPAMITLDADYRTFCQGAHNALVSIGTLVQTADTGQLNLSTVTRPSIGTYAGYEIFRFNDALQATVPIFVKVEYGSSATAVTIPALGVTCGSGTDGAGNLTFAGPRIYGGPGQATSWPRQWKPLLACGNPSGFALSLNIDPTGSGNSYDAFLSVERTRDANGIATSDGWINCGGASGGSVGTGGISVHRAGVAGTALGGTGNTGPIALTRGVTGLGTDVAIAQMIYWVGKPVYGLSWVGVPYTEMYSNASNCVVYCTFNASVLGSTHTYMVLNHNNSSTGIPGSMFVNAAYDHCIAMLWE